MTVDCPICLDEQSPSDVIYALPCTTCNYNFCTKCVETFHRSSQDDYQVASDGSKHVKVRISCPQCRCKYNLNIVEVLLLRKAHKLALAILPPPPTKTTTTTSTTKERDDDDDNDDIQQRQPMEDNQLSASLLAQKQEFMRQAKQKSVELAHGLYCKVLRDSYSSRETNNKPSSFRNDYASREASLDEAKKLWQRLFEILPSHVSTTPEKQPSKDFPNHDDDNNNDTATSPQHTNHHHDNDNTTTNPTTALPLPLLQTDPTLFLGLGDCMSIDEQEFVTRLFTNGTAHGLAQAAFILNGILKLDSSQATQARQMVAKMSFEKTSKKSLERLERLRKAFPLANHMPGYFVLPAFSKSQKFLQVKDDTWDGTIIPPKQAQKYFDQVYGDHVLASPASTGLGDANGGSDYHPPTPVIVVQSVRGAAGRVGLRKGDIVTHINELETTDGMTADGLLNYIHEQYAKDPTSEISITVNANVQTARFLQLRHRLLSQCNMELI